MRVRVGVRVRGRVRVRVRESRRDAHGLKGSSSPSRRADGVSKSKVKSSQVKRSRLEGLQFVLPPVELM
jgi:hypothetical protein